MRRVRIEADGCWIWTGPDSGKGRGGGGRRMDALLDLCDERIFPLQALDLPGAEGDKNDAQQRRAKHNRPPRPRRTGHGRACALLRVHGLSWCIAASIMLGIMLWFMLYITQIEPLSMMTTTITVNIMANIDQPPSILVFMCRK